PTAASGSCYATKGSPAGRDGWEGFLLRIRCRYDCQWYAVPPRQAHRRKPHPAIWHSAAGNRPQNEQECGGDGYGSRAGIQAPPLLEWGSGRAFATTRTRGGVRVFPTTRTRGGVRVFPTTRTRAGVRIFPTTRTRGGGRLFPTPRTRAGVRIFPTTRTRGGVRVFPTTRTRGGVRVFPRT